MSGWGDDAPISAGEAARLFHMLLDADGLLLAVSGGPDSMALMLLAAVWARAPGRPPIAVATVDHGLRPQSLAEAEAVGRAAATLGLPHRILPWTGVKPKTRIQERAREARHRLLAAHALECGARHVVFAHHADDQAETVVFRLVRGSGPGGLAGMAPLQERHGVTLARPLLAVSKGRLVATCRATGQAFFDDPSNADERFARPRLRRLLPLLAAEGFDREALLRLARRAGQADEALRRQACETAQGLSRAHPPEGLVVDLVPLRTEPAEIVGRVLRSLIAEAGGGAASPRLDRLDRFVERLLPPLRSGRPFKATLAGTVVTLDDQGKVVITRETTRRRGRSPAR